jgi:hypothetical protein
MNDPRHAAPVHEPVESERNAYNLAFSELGLDWFWDEQTYARIRAASTAQCPVRQYLADRSPHLLRAYDADFIVSAVEARRPRATPD